MLFKRCFLSCVLMVVCFVSLSLFAAETSNGLITVFIDEEHGTLRGITKGASPFNLLSDAGDSSLWKLILDDGSLLTPAEAGQFECRIGAGGDGLILEWSHFPDRALSDLQVTVTIELTEEKAESIWDISIEASETLALRHVVFPRISTLREQPGECVAVPFWMGEKTSTARNFLNPPEAAPLRRGWEYPGLLSLQCISFYGDEGGLLLHTRDSSNMRREFAVFGEADNGLGLEIIHGGTSDGSRFSLPGKVYLSAFMGDWYDAMDLYRKERDSLPYASESRAKNSLLPEWVEETGLWIWNRDVSPGVLPPAMALQETLGLPVSLFWHWWHGCAYDAGFPEYLPPREGTEPFKKVLQEAQETGIHAIVYMNQRLWGMETESWQEKDAQRFAVKRPDGKIQPEIYNTFTQSPCASMCMSTPFWRKTYADIAVEALLDLGVDGIYMDQACSSLACYDPTHNHPPGGGPWWMEGFQALAADIRQRSLPEKIPALAGEGCGEAWLPHLDLMLSLQVSLERYSTPGQWEPVPLFHAVYHDCARFFGNYSSLTRPPYDSKWPEESAPDNALTLLDRKFSTQFRLEQGRSFVWGQIPCIANFLPEHLEERKEEMDFLKDLAHTRQRSLKYLKDGTMLRPPEIGSDRVEIPTSRLSIYAGQHDTVQEYSCEVPAVLAASWLAADGAMAVALVNITEEVRKVTLNLEDSEYPLGASGTIRQILADQNLALGEWKAGKVHQDLNLPGSSVCLVEFISDEAAFTLETDHVRWAVGNEGKVLSLWDKDEEEELLSLEKQQAFSSVFLEGETLFATSVLPAEDGYKVRYGAGDVEAHFRVERAPDYFRLTLLSMNDERVQSIELLDMPLKLKGTEEERTAVSMLAGNLQTRVPGIPSPVSRIQGSATSRFGLAGACLNVIVCPRGSLRQAMQEVVSNSPELPRHRDPAYPPVGGPWALDAATNQGSYLFDFGSLTEETVDEWIALAQDLGFKQIDFHIGTSLRFGDLTPNEKLFPKGRESVKAVIDKLHEAGISAGLHTYAFFIAKNSPYITPVPDPRLGKDATYTLAVDLGTEDSNIVVEESTADVKIDTGFFARNSVTLQIDDELIIFSGVSGEAPFTFTSCTRGAHGTAVAAHEAGAAVHKLKECFGLFCPDGDSTLFAEIAAVTAETFNECGFDMIYLDALDGSDILAGGEHAWYYAPKFAFEIASRLERPALFEMSTMSHHLWFVRARMGAWDHPARSHKRFIDLHCEVNEQGSTMYLPMNLGWWAVKNWQDGIASAWSEPTWADDIEYLLCKALGNDFSLSLMGVNPENLSHMPAFQRLIPLFKAYESLRLAGVVPESMKEQLRQPGAEYILKKADVDDFQFCEAAVHKHVADAANPESLRWTVENNFHQQKLRIRIETLLSPAPYDSEEAVVLQDFAEENTLDLQRENYNVSASVSIEDSTLQKDASMAVFQLKSLRENQESSWAQFGTTFSPPKNAKDRTALGTWVHGDGSGALLNLQTLSAAYTTAGGIGDHYVKLDFTGWRYVSLVEFEGGNIPEWQWPYGNHYSIYREHVDYSALQSFSLWFNNLTPGEEVRCAVAPVKALPLEESLLRRPTLLVNGSPLFLPVDIPTGCCLEYDGQGKAALYDKKGKVLTEIDVEEAVMLKEGQNILQLSMQSTETMLPPRARITLLTEGAALRE